MPKVLRHDVEIHYETSGNPEAPRGALLLIPGLTATSLSFPSLSAALREEWFLVAIDPRGAGRTVPRFSGFTLAEVAQDAVAVLDELGIAQAHVLGISMGGMIAQELALAAPERVRGLVLTCTTMGRDGGLRASPKVMAKLAAGLVGGGKGLQTAEGVARAVGDVLFAGDTPLAKQAEFFEPRVGDEKPTRGGIMAQLNAIRQYSTASRLKTLDLPTLVIHGDSDVLVPTGNAKLLADAIPGAELAILPGGHVFFYEHHDAYFDRVNTFLERVEANPGGA